MNGLTPVQELEHLRHVERVLRERVAQLEQDLRIAQGGHAVMFDLWCREVRPGKSMWRIRRRREALEAGHV